MNCKGGMYGVAIGLMAITLLGFSIFSVQGELEEGQTHSYVGVMSDVRMTWQNSVMLLDDAMEDAILDKTCGALNGTDILNNDYLTPTMTEFNAGIDPGPVCTYSSNVGVLQPSVVGGNLQFHLLVECERTIEVDGETLFKARYAKVFKFENTC